MSQYGPAFYYCFTSRYFFCCRPLDRVHTFSLEIYIPFCFGTCIFKRSFSGYGTVVTSLNVDVNFSSLSRWIIHSCHTTIMSFLCFILVWSQCLNTCVTTGIMVWRDKVKILGKESRKTGKKSVVPPEIRRQYFPSNKPKHLPLH